MPNPKGTSRIPRRNSSALMQLVRLESPDAKTLWREILNTCLIDKEPERIWKTNSISMICNPDLNRRYDARKKVFKEQGRKAKEIEDRLAFSVQPWSAIQKISKKGPCCEETKRHVLGDTRFGLHLNRNYDVLLRYLTYKKYTGVQFIIVFKVMFGKVKSVIPRLWGETGSIEPTPNFDSHVSTTKPEVEMGVCDAQDHNFVYVYEYDEETAMPSLSPSQILPCAVIGIVRTEEKIQKPLVWTSIKQKGKQKRAETGQSQRKIITRSHSENDCSNISMAQNSTVEINDGKVSSSSSVPRGTTLRQLLCSSSGIKTASSVPNSPIPVTSERDVKDGVTDTQYNSNVWDIPEVSIEIDNDMTDYPNASLHTGPLELDSNVTIFGNMAEIPQILTDASTNNPELCDEKSSLLRRLQEVEQEIQNKQKKLKELRMHREFGNESINEDKMSDKDNDIVAMTILRMKKDPGVEDSTDELQPLDLSKSSCLQAEELKTSEFRNDESETSDTQAVKIPLSSLTDTKTGTFQKKKETVEGTGLHFNINAAKIDSAVTIKKEIDSDPPTPTQDEPQTEYFNVKNIESATKQVSDTNTPILTLSSISNIQLPVVTTNTCVSQKLEHRLTNTTDASENEVVKMEDSEVKLKKVTNETSAKNKCQQEITLKKATSFFEKYIEKKQALGQKFKQIQSKMEISGVGVAQDFLPLCTTIKKECDTEISAMANEIHFNPQIVSVTSLAGKKQENTEILTKKDIATERDPRNRVRQRSSSSDNSDSAASTKKVDPRLERRFHLENENLDRNDSWGMSSQINQHNKLTENLDVENNSSFPCEQNNSSVQLNSLSRTTDMSDSGYCKTSVVTDTDQITYQQNASETAPKTAKLNDILNNSNKQTKSIKECVITSNTSGELPIPNNLPTEVAKTLQDLGTAINKIKKQFEESDENSVDSIPKCDDINHQNEETDIDKSESSEADENLQNNGSIVSSKTPETESQESVVEQDQETIDSLINKSTAEMFWNTSKMCDEHSTNEENEAKEINMNSFKDLVQKQYEVLRQSAKHSSDSDDTEFPVSPSEITDMTHMEDIDFTPRNMGFSSYLPEAENIDTGDNLVQASKLLLHDVSSIKSESNVDTSGETNNVKQEGDAGSSEQHYIEKLKVTKVISKKQAWKIRKNIKRNLIQIRQLSSTSNFRNDKPKTTEKSKKRRARRSRSKSRNREKRKRRSSSNRSVSLSSRCSSPKLSRRNKNSPREISPIRDPNFIPFHDKGRILTQYFRERRQRIRLERLRTSVQNRYRKESVRKAKMTLARNLVTKPFCPNTVVGRRVLLPTPNIKPEPIQTFENSNNNYDRSLDQNGSRTGERERSLPRSLENQSDHESKNRRSREINRDKLIFDRFGNEITLNLPPRSRNRITRRNSRDRSMHVNRFRNGNESVIESDRSIRRRSRDRSTESDMFRNRINTKRTAESDIFSNYKARDRYDERDRVERRRSSEDHMIHQRTEYTRRPRNISPSLEKSNPDKKDEVDDTLSKAMTTLLKRILFDGQGNDNSAEGKMADMVFEMVKRKVTSDTKTVDPPTSSKPVPRYSPEPSVSANWQNDNDLDTYWKEKNDDYFKRRSTNDVLDSGVDTRLYSRHSRERSSERYVYKSSRSSPTRDSQRWKRSNDPDRTSSRSRSARDKQSLSPDRGKRDRSFSPPYRFKSDKGVREWKSFEKGSYYGRGQRGGFQSRYSNSRYNSYKSETNTGPWSYNARGRGFSRTDRPYSRYGYRHVNSDRKERKKDG